MQTHLAHVDGVMLGRLAHDPYALARVDAALSGNTPAPPRGVVLRRLRPYIEERRVDGVRLGAISRHVLGLYHGEPGGKAFRRVLSERAHAADAGWEVIEAALAEVRVHAGRAAA